MNTHSSATTRMMTTIEAFIDIVPTDDGSLRLLGEAPMETSGKVVTYTQGVSEEGSQLLYALPKTIAIAGVAYEISLVRVISKEDEASVEMKEDEGGERYLLAPQAAGSKYDRYLEFTAESFEGARVRRGSGNIRTRPPGGGGL